MKRKCIGLEVLLDLGISKFYKKLYCNFPFLVSSKIIVDIQFD